MYSKWIFSSIVCFLRVEEPDLPVVGGLAVVAAPRANEQTKYAPPSPHHMPSSLRERVIGLANCLRIDVVVAKRSGTATHSTS